MTEVRRPGCAACKVEDDDVSPASVVDICHSYQFRSFSFHRSGSDSSNNNSGGGSSSSSWGNMSGITFLLLSCVVLSVSVRSSARRDLYAILGLKPDASERDIARAFRQVYALRQHPLHYSNPQLPILHRGGRSHLAYRAVPSCFSIDSFFLSSFLLTDRNFPNLKYHFLISCIRFLLFRSFSFTD